MMPSAFSDKASPPDDTRTLAVLGPAAPRWTRLTAELAHRFAPTTQAWAWSGSKHGWTLRIAQRKRPVAYLTPLDGAFRVSLALGEEAVTAALASDLPLDVRAAIQAAPMFPEGRAVRILVESDEACAHAVALAGLRMRREGSPGRPPG